MRIRLMNLVENMLRAKHKRTETYNAGILTDIKDKHNMNYFCKLEYFESKIHSDYTYFKDLFPVHKIAKTSYLIKHRQ